MEFVSSYAHTHMDALMSLNKESIFFSSTGCDCEMSDPPIKSRRHPNMIQV